MTGLLFALCVKFRGLGLAPRSTVSPTNSAEEPFFVNKLPDRFDSNVAVESIAERFENGRVNRKVNNAD